MKIYVSHSIRGRSGVDATATEMELNCQRAMGFGKWLKEKFDYDFYIPAEHDLFVQKAHFKNYLTEKQILDIDCDIISECDAMIIYTPDGYISRGMNIEIDYTTEIDLPTITINHISFLMLESLDGFLSRVEDITLGDE